MNRILTVIATGLTVLPIAAFAQGATGTMDKQAPAATATAPAVTTSVPAKTAPDTAMKTAPATTAKSDVKAPAVAKKGELHGTNTVKTHQAPVAPVKG